MGRFPGIRRHSTVMGPNFAEVEATCMVLLWACKGMAMEIWEVMEGTCLVSILVVTRRWADFQVWVREECEVGTEEAVTSASPRVWTTEATGEEEVAITPERTTKEGSSTSSTACPRRLRARS